MAISLQMMPFGERHWSQLSLAIAAGLVCALAMAEKLPVVLGAATAIAAPLCSASAEAGSLASNVEVISSHALPNVPGKRVTVVRVTYGPGGFTPPHRHG